jgi:hypothetical protein
VKPSDLSESLALKPNLGVAQFPYPFDRFGISPSIRPDNLIHCANLPNILFTNGGPVLMPSAATLETSRMATIPRLHFPAFGERSKAAGLSGVIQFRNRLAFTYVPFA